MKIYRRNNFSAAVLNRIYEVDGTEITLRDFLNENFYKTKIKKLSPNEVRDIVDLYPGENKTINRFQIKRIS